MKLLILEIFTHLVGFGFAAYAILNKDLSKTDVYF